MNGLCKTNGSASSPTIPELKGQRNRFILHVDMDHFFSAVEERKNPLLKGKPLVVGANPKDGKGRGVVKTCNYEARKFGIHSGMPISKAWQLCPNAAYVQGDYSVYNQVSASVMKILRSYSNQLQQWGLDEAFLDVSSKVCDLEDAVKLAVNIKQEIFKRENLTCSIGIASNKLVAKIASDHEKPDGLTVVPQDGVKQFLVPLPVKKLLWVGEKTAQKMREMGIKTVGDLAAYDVSALVERFGMMGERFHQFAHGIYMSKVAGKKSKMKSVGHQSTFESDTEDQTRILECLDSLCTRVHKRIVDRNTFFKTATVKIRYENYQTYTYAKTLHNPSNRFLDIQKTARTLFLKNFRRDLKVRLVGVRLSNLTSSKGQQTLF